MKIERIANENSIVANSLSAEKAAKKEKQSFTSGAVSFDAQQKNKNKEQNNKQHDAHLSEEGSVQGEVLRSNDSESTLKKLDIIA